MSKGDQAELVNQVVSICQVDENTARSYLEAFNWDVNATVENILNETDESEIPVHHAAESSSMTYHEVGAPYMANPTFSDPEKSGNSEPRIATLSSVTGRSKHGPNSDDEGQAFYVGGAEHGGGGQQVLGPPRVDNPESFVQNIFRAARERGAEALDRTRVADHTSNQESQSFSGTGYRLGSTMSDPVVKVSGKPSSSSLIGLGSEESDFDGEKKSVVVKMWNNGFSLNDGPLRSYTDPSSLEFMAAIKTGHIPTELVAAAHGHEVHVLLEDHHNEPYQAPPEPKLKPFSGVGRLLGNPTPKVVTNTPVSPPSSSGTLPPCPKVDESKPSTQLQVRMPDGSRIIVNLNNQHTVGDLRAAVIHQRPELASEAFSLSTAFPRKEITDESATLASANLLNASVVVGKR
ncbi:hypothetical protein Aperf_G00000127180 [Anoplocephala perfoliata]